MTAVRFELCPVPAALAERYRAEGAWDDRSLGQFLSDALLEDPTRRLRIWSPTQPYLGTVGEVYDDALRPIGLQQSQLPVLVALAIFGEPGAPMNALAQALVMDRTTLTRNVRPLEKAGLLRVARSPADARAYMP